MSFSNASTGDKPADPYKQANAEEPDLKTKIDELVEFMTRTKFGMMTTHDSSSQNLVSRAMALAATVRPARSSTKPILTDNVGNSGH